MSDRKPYDQDLRAIGQALEAKRISVFELQSQGDRYVIRGDPEKDPSLLGRLREWQDRLKFGSPAPVLNYAGTDIERLDREGKAKRVKPDRLPDFYSLPNTLRTMGRYLDSQGAELLEIHKRPLSVTILYRKKDGHPNMEERSIASFYDLFIALHRRRAKEKTVNPGR